MPLVIFLQNDIALILARFTTLLKYNIKVKKSMLSFILTSRHFKTKIIKDFFCQAVGSINAKFEKLFFSSITMSDNCGNGLKRGAHPFKKKYIFRVFSLKPKLLEW